MFLPVALAEASPQASTTQFLVFWGIPYTLGVVFYLWEGIPFNHAIWHLFVLGGSVCHFFCILFYVLPVREG